MIGRLRGKIIEKQPPLLVLDVGGVGYEVEAPLSTFYQLPEQAVEIMLYIHFVVREDAQLLFGFYHEQDRTLFRNLIKINGVGPKLALTILSSIEPSEFLSCIQNGDAARLVRIPGVGKKTAERLLIEMRDRIKDWEHSSIESNATLPEMQMKSDPSKDAINALVSLGYKPQDASKMVSRVELANQGVEEIIRQALKEVAA